MPNAPATAKPRRNQKPSRAAQANAAAERAAGTRVQAYTRERRILSNYTHHLYALTTDTDALIATCFGANLAGRRLDAVYERLDEDVPELLRHLRYEEQEEIDRLLSHPTPDLAHLVRLVLKMEQKLLQREPLRPQLNDEAQYRAAGLGRLTSENYGRLRPGYIPDLLPEPKQQLVIVRIAKPRRRRPVSPWIQGVLFASFAPVGALANI